jgi:hypothetical protein
LSVTQKVPVSTSMFRNVSPDLPAAVCEKATVHGKRQSLLRLAAELVVGGRGRLPGSATTQLGLVPDVSGNVPVMKPR